jgi:hypothetical protein
MLGIKMKTLILTFIATTCLFSVEKIDILPNTNLNLTSYLGIHEFKFNPKQFNSVKYQVVVYTNHNGKQSQSSYDVFGSIVGNGEYSLFLKQKGNKILITGAVDGLLSMDFLSAENIDLKSLNVSAADNAISMSDNQILMLCGRTTNSVKSDQLSSYDWLVGLKSINK